MIDASQMTEAQLHAKLQRGYDDYKTGRTQNAADAILTLDSLPDRFALFESEPEHLMFM